MKKDEIKEMLTRVFSNLSKCKLLGLTIYGEARGESLEGRIAVGSVILERVDHRDWDGKTIHEVCLMPYQFSCYLPDDPNFIALKLIAESWDEKYRQSIALQQCYKIAKGLIEDNIPRTKEIADNHCCQYKTIDCKADWAGKMKLVVTIGRHEFYA